MKVSYSAAGGRAIIRRLLQCATEGWVAAGTAIPMLFHCPNVLMIASVRGSDRKATVR